MKSTNCRRKIIGKLDFVKFEIFDFSKNTIKKIKRKATCRFDLVFESTVLSSTQ